MAIQLNTHKYVVTKIGNEYMLSDVENILNSANDFKDYSVVNIKESFEFTTTSELDFNNIDNWSIFESKEEIEEHFNTNLANYKKIYNNSYVKKQQEIEAKQFIQEMKTRFNVDVNEQHYYKMQELYIKQGEQGFVPNVNYIIENNEEENIIDNLNYLEDDVKNENYIYWNSHIQNKFFNTKEELYIYVNQEREMLNLSHLDIESFNKSYLTRYSDVDTFVNELTSQQQLNNDTLSSTLIKLNSWNLKEEEVNEIYNTYKDIPELLNNLHTIEDIQFKAKNFTEFQKGILAVLNTLESKYKILDSKTKQQLSIATQPLIKNIAAEFEKKLESQFQRCKVTWTSGQFNIAGLSTLGTDLRSYMDDDTNYNLIGDIKNDIFGEDYETSDNIENLINDELEHIVTKYDSKIEEIVDIVGKYDDLDTEFINDERIEKIRAVDLKSLTLEELEKLNNQFTDTISTIQDEENLREEILESFENDKLKIDSLKYSNLTEDNLKEMKTNQLKDVLITIEKSKVLSVEELHKQELQAKLIYSLWKQDKGEIIEDIKINYKEVLEQGKKLSEVITDKDLNDLIHNFELEGGDMNEISADLKQLKKINSKLSDIETLQKKKTQVNEMLMQKWDKLERKSLHNKELFEQGYNDLNEAKTLKEYKEIEQRFENKFKSSYVTAQAVKMFPTYPLHEYLIQKRKEQETTVFDMLSQNKNSILEENGIYNKAGIATTHMQHLHHNCDVCFENGKLVLDLNSYDRGQIKNEIDVSELFRIQKILEKELTPSEAKSLTLLSSNKIDNQMVIDIQRLQKNIVNFFEVKQENLQKQIMADNVVTTEEQYEVKKLEEQKIKTVRGV